MDNRINQNYLNFLKKSKLSNAILFTYPSRISGARSGSICLGALELRLPSGPQLDLLFLQKSQPPALVLDWSGCSCQHWTRCHLNRPSTRSLWSFFYHFAGWTARPRRRPGWTADRDSVSSDASLPGSKYTSARHSAQTGSTGHYLTRRRNPVMMTGGSCRCRKSPRQYRYFSHQLFG